MSRLRLAPSRSIAATVASSTPVTAPRQPACAAAMTPGALVGEEHRRAIRGQDAERQAFALGHHRVGVRPLGLRPGLLDDDDVGAVDLMDGGERVEAEAELQPSRGGDFRESRRDRRPRTCCN